MRAVHGTVPIQAFHGDWQYQRRRWRPVKRRVYRAEQPWLAIHRFLAVSGLVAWVALLVAVVKGLVGW